MVSPSIEQRSHPLHTILLLALVAALGTACGQRSEPASGRGATAHKAGTPAAPAERTAASQEGVHATPAVVSSGPPVAVEFPTDDGVSISATLRVGRAGTTPVVLVHQLGSARAEWDPLVAKLAELGLTTLAIDLRGHGESTHGTGANARAYAYGSFRDTDWRATQKDVRAAIDFLAAHEQVHAARVVLIGSSIGGTACIAAAAEDPRVASLVVLSPGRAYHGFDAILPASRLAERPLLVLHSSEELPSQETSGVLDRIVANSTVRVVPGSAHGVSMLRDDPTQLTAIVDFVGSSPARP